MKSLWIGAVVLLVVLVVYFGALAARRKWEMEGMKQAFGTVTQPREHLERPEPLRELTNRELLRERTYKEYLEEFDGLLSRSLEMGDFSSPLAPSLKTLEDACRSALNGGKRLRSIILMEIARMVSKQRWEEKEIPPVDPAEAALAAEYFHAASLVIDDHPAFDGDEERRGKKSVWAATSPSVALMAAVALMGNGLRGVARQVEWMKDKCPHWVNADRVGTLLCAEAGRLLGPEGAPGGQLLDMTPPQGSGGDEEIVRYLADRKTAPFFEFAFVAGWLVGGGSPGDDALNELRGAGRAFGLAFQIADDIGDLEKDKARRLEGKPGWNYAAVHGVEKAEAEMVKCLRLARAGLAGRGLVTPLWDEITGKVFQMTV